MILIGQAGEALHSLFQDMDGDRNGKIDSSEYTTYMIKYAFNKLDDNDSKIITSAEWDFIDNVENRESHDELFKNVDKNNDRMISFGEFSEYAEKHSNIKDTFRDLDKDSDLILTPAEISARPPFKMVTVRL